MSDRLVVILVFGGFGAITLASGLLMQSGVWKAWFATKRVPVLVPTSYYFGFIPAGLGLLSAGLVFVVGHNAGSVLLCCAVLPCLALSIVLAVWQPWWIKPAWYRWLEERHGDIIPLLQEEARAMGRWKWQRRVATQAGLEQWVAEVRQKRGLD
jgi:hypothetical protein